MTLAKTPPSFDLSQTVTVAKAALDIEANALRQAADRLDGGFTAVVARILACTGRVVVMGMGITFLPALYVASEIRETDPLRVADVFGVNMYRDHALAWRSRSPARPLFRRLAQTIRELVPNTAASELRVLY